MAARDELVAAIAGRYSQADRTARPYPGRVHGGFRLSPQVRDAPASRWSTDLALWAPARSSDLRRCYTGSADRDLGGVRPDLRQAAATDGAGSG